MAVKSSVVAVSNEGSLLYSWPSLWFLSHSKFVCAARLELLSELGAKFCPWALKVQLVFTRCWDSDLLLLYSNCQPVWTPAAAFYYPDVYQDDKSHHLNPLDQVQWSDKPVVFWLNPSHWLKWSAPVQTLIEKYQFHPLPGAAVSSLFKLIYISNAGDSDSIIWMTYIYLTSCWWPCSHLG